MIRNIIDVLNISGTPNMPNTYSSNPIFVFLVVSFSHLKKVQMMCGFNSFLNKYVKNVSKQTTKNPQYPSYVMPNNCKHFGLLCSHLVPCNLSRSIWISPSQYLVAMRS